MLWQILGRELAAVDTGREPVCVCRTSNVQLFHAIDERSIDLRVGRDLTEVDHFCGVRVLIVVLFIFVLELKL